MKLKEKANKLKQNISAIYIATKNTHTPIIAKIFAGMTVAYALSPIDIVPDFIPVLGYLDDIILLPIFIWISIKLIPKEIMEQSKNEAKDLWKDGKPKKWYYGIPIIVFWLIIASVIIKIIVN